jgi:hypothetical protein
MFEAMGQKCERELPRSMRDGMVEEVVFRIDPEWQMADEELFPKISQEQMSLQTKEEELGREGETVPLERLEEGEDLLAVQRFCGEMEGKIKELEEAEFEVSEEYKGRIKSLLIGGEVVVLVDGLDLDRPGRVLLYRALRDLWHGSAGNKGLALKDLSRLLKEEERLHEQDRYELILERGRTRCLNLAKVLEEQTAHLESLMESGSDNLCRDIFSLVKETMLTSFLRRCDVFPYGMKISVPDHGLKWFVDNFEVHKLVDNLVGNTINHWGYDYDLIGDALSVGLWMGVSNERVLRLVWMDNGVGFSDEMLEIRENGKQRALEEGVTTDGTGIGLWSIDQFVTGQGGEIRLLNGEQLGEPYFGAIVVVDMPIKK